MDGELLGDAVDLLFAPFLVFPPFVLQHIYKDRGNPVRVSSALFGGQGCALGVAGWIVFLLSSKNALCGFNSTSEVSREREVLVIQFFFHGPDLERLQLDLKRRLLFFILHLKIVILFIAVWFI
jgi:hypothetical protein